MPSRPFVEGVPSAIAQATIGQRTGKAQHHALTFRKPMPLGPSRPRFFLSTHLRNSSNQAIASSDSQMSLRREYPARHPRTATG